MAYFSWNPWQRWLRRQQKPAAGGARQRRRFGPRFAVPRLEQLEDRTLLAASPVTASDLISALLDQFPAVQKVADIFSNAPSIPLIGQALDGLSDLKNFITDVENQVQQVVDKSGLFQNSSGEWFVPIEIPVLNQQFPFNLGLNSFLKLQTSGSVQTNIVIDYLLGFRLDGSTIKIDPNTNLEQDNTGHFTDLSGPSFPALPLAVRFAASLPGFQANFSLDGFLFTQAQDEHSVFNGTFGLGLDPADPTKLKASFSGDLSLRLGLDIRFVDPSVYTTQINPEFKTDFGLDWTFAVGDGDPMGAASGGTISGYFDNFTIELGPLFNNLLSPIVSELQIYTEPLAPLLNFMKQQVPILDEFGIHETFQDLLDQNSPSGLSNIIQAIDIINNYSPNATGAVTLPGKFTFGDVRSVTFQSLANSINPPPGLDSVVSTVQNLLSQQIASGGGSSGGDSGGSIDADGLFAAQFPILSNPEAIIPQLLLGQDPKLFTLTVNEPLHLSYPLEFGIPDILAIGLKGKLNIDANLSAGYDTSGLREFINGGEKNIGDLADGFYFDKSTGLNINGSLDLAADLLVGHISGGISANVNVAMRTPANTQLVHLNQINASDLDCVFDITGSVDAQADITVALDLPVGPSITIFSYPLADEQLVSFQTSCPEGPTTQTPQSDEILRIQLRDGDQTIHVHPYMVAEKSDPMFPSTDDIYGLEVDDGVGAGAQVMQYPMARYTQNQQGFQDGWHYYNQNGNISPGDAGIKGIMTVGNPDGSFPGGNHTVIVDTADPAAVSTGDLLEMDAALGIDLNQLPVLLIGGSGNDDLEYNGSGPVVLMGGGSDPSSTNPGDLLEAPNSLQSVLFGGPGNSILHGRAVEFGGTWADAGLPSFSTTLNGLKWPTAMIGALGAELTREGNIQVDGHHILSGGSTLYGGRGYSKLTAGFDGSLNVPNLGGGTYQLYGGPGTNDFVIHGPGTFGVHGGAGTTNTLIVEASSADEFVPPPTPDQITVSYLPIGAPGILTDLTVEETTGGNKDLQALVDNNVQNLSIFPGETANSITVNDLSQSTLQNVLIGELTTIPVGSRIAQTVTIKGASQFNSFDISNVKQTNTVGHKQPLEATSIMHTVLDKPEGKVIGSQDIVIDGLGQGDQLILDSRSGQNSFSDTLDPSMTYTTNIRSSNSSDLLSVYATTAGDFTVSASQITFALPPGGSKIITGSFSLPTIDYSSNLLVYVSATAGTNQVTVDVPAVGSGFNMNIQAFGDAQSTLIVNDAPADTEGDYTFGHDVFGYNLHLHRAGLNGGAQGNADITYHDFASFTLNPSVVSSDSQNNIDINILVAPIIVNTQGGNNYVSIASDSQSLESIHAPVTINGGKDADTTVTIDDQNNPYTSSGSNFYAVDGNYVLRQNQPASTSTTGAPAGFKQFSPLLHTNSLTSFELFTKAASAKPSFVDSFVNTLLSPADAALLGTLFTGSSGSSKRTVLAPALMDVKASPHVWYNAYDTEYGPGGSAVATIYYNNVQKLDLYAGGRSNTFDVSSPEVPFADLHDSVATPQADNVTINGLQGQLELNVGNPNNTTSVSGPLQLNTPSGAALLASIPAVAPADGSSIPIIDNDTQAPVQGTFSNAASGTVIQGNGVNYTVSYQAAGDSGTDQQPDVAIVHVNTPPSNIHTDIALSSLQEGATVSGHLLFDDPDVLDTHTVTIHWGDNTADEVINLGPGVTVAPISHTFAEEGSFTVTATVDDGHPSIPSLGIGSGAVSAQLGSVQVVDAPLVLTNTPPALTEGINTNVVLATFSDAGSDGTPNDYKATVTWGDGTVSQTGDGTGTVTVVPAGPNTFQVVGSHTYSAEEGTVYFPTVTVADVGGARTFGPLSLQAGPAAPIAQAGAVAVRAPNGDIYVAGGSAFEVFLGANGRRVESPWAPLANLPVPLTGMAMAAGQDGEIYVFGGSSSAPLAGSTGTYGYNPATNTWQKLAPMPQAVIYAAAVTGPDGLIYVLGGQVTLFHNLFQVRILNTVQVYNPKTNSWSTRSPMPTRRSQLAAMVGSDGNIYALGGHAGSGTPLTTVEVFNPTSNSWSTGPSMTQGRSNFTAVQGPLGLIYALGGDAADSVEVLDPTKQTWFQATGLNLAQSSFAAAATPNGPIYLIGGLVNNNVSNTVQLLQLAPVTLADAPLVRHVSEVNAVETVPFTGVLASFTDAGNDGTTHDYTGTIQWPTGAPVPAQFQLNNDGSVSVLGSYTFPSAGIYYVSVNVQDQGGASVILYATIKVQSMLTDLTPQRNILYATEGTDPGSQVLATFSTLNPNAQQSDFTATIDWGDGSQANPDVQTGVVQLVSQNSSGSTFEVMGDHTYVDRGTYATTITITPPAGSPLTSTRTWIDVGDAALTDTTRQSTIQAQTGVDTGPQVLATFVDANPNASISDYVADLTVGNALVDWGDGTQASPDQTTAPILKEVMGDSGGYYFSVVGDHTYANSGTYTVSVRVSDIGGSFVVTQKTSFQVAPAATTTTLTSVAYPAGIVSAYQGDGNANDAIGTNNGTVQGNVTFEPGRFGQAFHFDGATGEGISIPASSSLDVGSGNGLTLTAWINPDDVSSQEPIIEWTGGMHLWFSVTYGGAVGPGDLYASLSPQGAATSYIIYSAPGVVQAQQWQFVALTYDKSSGMATLYLNGQVVAQTNLGSITPYTASDLNLGRRSGVSQFAGGLDEVGIYNRALTTSEISALYAGTGNPSASGQPVVFTATVSAGSGTPSGAVAFSVDGGASQSVALTNGEAQITLNNLGQGSHSVTANYTPADGSFQASQASFTQTVQAAPSAGLFSNPIITTTGSSGRPVIVSGDFNGDGMRDVVVLNGGFNQPLTFGVFLGNGQGGFTPAPDSPVNTGITAQIDDAVAGDFNGDGNLDVAFTGVIQSGSQYTAVVDLWLGDGKGGFSEAPGFPMPMEAYGIAAAKFNGNLDLAIANGFHDSVTVLLNDGKGNFTATTLTGGINSPVAVAVGDFNGDGSVDLATVTQNNGLYVWLGDGHGNFQAASGSPFSCFTVPGGWDALQTGEFYGDGHLDLAVAGSDGYGHGYVTLLKGNGTGSFTQEPAIATNGAVTDVIAADFNGDNNSDLFLTESVNNPPSVQILLGDGRGGFSDGGSVNATPPSYYGSWPQVVVGDFDGNGTPDVAMLDSQFNLDVLLNRTPLFSNPLVTTTNSTGRVALVSGDFNGDGKADVVVLNGGFGLPLTLAVFLNNGQDGFSQPGSPINTGQSGNISGAVAGDFNGDGNLDVAFNVGTKTDLWLGDGNGGFTHAPGFPLAGDGLGLVAGNFNGNLDLAMANPDYNTITVLLNDGKGTFTANTFPAGIGEPGLIVAGDFNGDGNLDLAVASLDRGQANVFLGDGQGNFQAASNGPFACFTTPGGWNCLQVGKFYGDNRLDLVVAGLGGWVTILKGDGTGNFVQQPAIATNSTVTDLAVADFNANGTSDLFLVEDYNSPATVQVLLGNGQGGFTIGGPLNTTPQQGQIFSYPTVVIGDFNGDGKPDVAMLDNQLNLDVFLNQS